MEKLKRTLKEHGIIHSDYASLREILIKNIGRHVKIEFTSSANDYEISSRPCLIEDVDEDWVLVKLDKNETEKLIRIESIKSIQIK